MTWQLFTILQIAVFAGAALAALGLRNRRLRHHNEQLLTLCSQAHEELVAVTGKLAAMEAIAPPEKLLAERVKALTGDDPVVVVRRMVLEHEIKPRPDFAVRLTEHLASQEEGPPDEEEFARRWRLTREECQQLAMFLVADNPDILPAIRQLFEVIEPLDRAYDLSLPPLELPPPGAMKASAAADPQGAATATDEELDQDQLDALLAGAQGSVASDSATAGAAGTGPRAETPARTGTG